MLWYFVFFFVSGFCSILYELIWLRLAMAQFAVTTALVSIVLSAFMIGLGAGSWGAGRYIRHHSPLGFPPLRLYAATELCIGLAAILVPYELIAGRILLHKIDAGNPLSTGAYYMAAGFWIVLTLVPWCACMGATFPFAMAAIRENFSGESARSFSYLYLANVLGAVSGAFIPLLLIESLGFKGTLHFGALLNLALACSAMILSRVRQRQSAESPSHQPMSQSSAAMPAPAPTAWPYFLLFFTGLTSMGVEVVWIRLFTVGLGTVVYAFAAILGLYLGATYLGSLLYRRSMYRRKTSAEAPGNLFLASLAFSVVLPLLLSDPRVHIVYTVRVIAIIPFSLAVGFVTPMILDRVSQGDPDRAGRGYAVNIIGCVLGPLVAGFFLLPLMGERLTLLAFAVPWIVVSFRRPQITQTDPSSTQSRGAQPSVPQRNFIAPLAVGALTLLIVFATKSFESQFTPREVRRDSTATVTAMGASRTQKQLLVNGIGMTGLTPITKMIAHLPLAFLSRPPKNVLVICFGMGTTHRSAMSWGVSSTAVELVPSVVSVFPFFYSDAGQIIASPRSSVVIDDGRFYMERSSQQYDVIAIDPPPPVEAAASSLLYSEQFYAIAKLHLAPDGILQQWFPAGSQDPAIIASVTKALRESFPYVRVFRSIEGWGYHFLASKSPLPVNTAASLASHMPPAAVADLLEWGPAHAAEQQFAGVLNQELSLDALIAQDPDVPALQDDRPVNEYFLLRRVRDPKYLHGVWERVLAHVGIKS
ncbi:MAG TPA: fused MFS/spermidine synthase [Terriglobales bacterium]|jgi:spermidine synthase|nr:fused MFS/spermidine synthase [Terriglobales bacterium]